jgi:hypothetical protein
LTLQALALQAIVIVDPPEVYNFEFKGMLEVIQLDALKVHAFCGNGPDAVQRVISCAAPLTSRYCIIVLPNVEPLLISKAQRERLRRHEIAHCNGWPLDHPMN